jgi:uncharacterized protein YdeI (YjbR/CyaY-like superfamily)
LSTFIGSQHKTDNILALAMADWAGSAVVGRTATVSVLFNGQSARFTNSFRIGNPMANKESTSAQSFKALLEPDGTRLRWVVARLPFDPVEVWPRRNGRRVKGDIEGFPFRTSLFPDPQGDGQILLVNRKMQQAAGVGLGQMAHIRMEPDLQERPTTLPPELLKFLAEQPALKRWFAQLSPSMRREIGKWVGEPKGAPTRLKRAEKMAERLMLAMEGERELPPILRAAFARAPKALAGWQKLTPTQRRNHLLGIFYYESVEARQKRADKAVEEALRAEMR